MTVIFHAHVPFLTWYAALPSNHREVLCPLEVAIKNIEWNHYNLLA